MLNDPRKDRGKINQIFTKTWGADFTDNPSFPEFTVKEFPNVSSIDFKNYLDQPMAVSNERRIFRLFISSLLFFSDIEDI